MDPMLYDMMGTENNEFPVTQKLQTDEEIKKLILQEDMDDIKRAIYLLTKGQPIQILSVYSNLNNLINDQDAFGKIMPIIQDELAQQSQETQIECARSLVKLFSKQQLKKQQVLQVLKLTMVIIRIWDQSVLDEWAEVIDSILQQIDYDIVKSELEDTALSLSEPSQHSMSKYIAVKIIGLIAKTKIEKPGTLYDKARLLCQDVDNRVRNALAENTLKYICLVSGTELTEIKFLDKVFELLYDQDIDIKVNAIQTLIDILKILSKNLIENRILSVLVELFKSINEPIMLKMSHQIGNIVYKLESIFAENPNQLGAIQTIYREWSQSKNPEIRYNVIYNMPYMIQTFEEKDFMKTVYVKALKDEIPQIKYCAVASLHEIMKFFGKDESAVTFRESLNDLFNDDDNNVKEKLVKSFPEILEVLFSENGPKRKQSLKQREIIQQKDQKEREEIFDLLADFGEKILESHMWRLEIQYLKGLKECLKYFAIEIYIENYFDFLIGRIHSGIKDVQELAMDDLVEMLRENFLSQITKQVEKRIEQEFAKGESFKNREKFFDIYEKMSKTFSRKHLKFCGFTECIINMSKDKLNRIKKRFINIGIELRRLIPPEDLILLSKFNDAANKLSLEKNKDVSDDAFAMQQELKSYTPNWYEAFNIEDKKRLEYEDEQRRREEKYLDDLKRNKSFDEREKYEHLFPQQSGSVATIPMKKSSGYKKSQSAGGKDSGIGSKSKYSPSMLPSTIHQRMNKSETLDMKKPSSAGIKTLSGNALYNMKKKSDSVGTKPTSTPDLEKIGLPPKSGGTANRNISSAQGYKKKPTSNSNF